jgi:mycofactocin system glycosyltransferase
MANHLVAAPLPQDAPIESGTRVSLDDDATFIDSDLVAGGSPWRLLRLRGASRPIVQRWKAGGVVEPGQELLARTLVSQGLLHPHFSPVDLSDETDVIIPVLANVQGLTSLLGQLRGLHVTVVDDGSANEREIADIVEAYGAQLVRLQENLGPASARNEGATKTKRPFLWFIDADVAVDDALLVLAQLASAFRDPLVATVAPRVVGSDGTGLRTSFEQRHSPLDLGDSRAIVVPAGRVSYVPSACLLVRRSAFGQGFDPSFRVGEDVDFEWRLHDEGWLLRYEPDVVVRHPARTSWKQWWQQRHDYGRSSGELAKRYGARLTPVRIDASTLAIWLSLFLRRPRLAARILSVAHRGLVNQLPGTTEQPEIVARQIVGTGVLILFGIGTLWRWRRQRSFQLQDLPLGVADDMAYATGVWRGAVQYHGWWAIRPNVTGTARALRSFTGRGEKRPPLND